MTEDFSDQEANVLYDNIAFEKESASYVKLYRNMMLQCVKDGIDNEEELKLIVNFMLRPESVDICNIIGIQHSSVKKFFKRLTEDENFKEEIKTMVKNKRGRTLM